eukprot:TRINITY_DN3928_c0_g1_i2.p2 TRINITY_DN3928_c0_g1~~TRINITY_DN3928_c0_g1_i2.p2  ORF type:complete len:214 (+),score=25.97 TRINITY_DN3928_c0_g1_i2:104-745(+)
MKDFGHGSEEDLSVAFYMTLSYATVVVLLVTVLFVASYWLLQRFLRSTKSKLIVGICATGLTTAFSTLLMVPLTSLLADPTLSDHHFVWWVNRGLMFVLWNMIFVGSNASLFLLLPFAYFYKEAFEGKKGRLAEAMTVMVIFVVILFSFFFLTHNIFLGEHGRGKNQLLVGMYTFTSAFGSFLLLLALPCGYSKIMKLCSALIVRAKHFDKVF